METVKTGRRPGKILWRVLLGVLALICAAVLELGKHTIMGWVLAAVVFAGFCAVRVHVLKTAGKGVYFGPSRPRFAAVKVLVTCASD